MNTLKYLCKVKKWIMKKTVRFTMPETLFPALPDIEIQVRYSATAEIETVSDVEVGFVFSDFVFSVNGERWQAAILPTESQGIDARKFLDRMREAARRELYRQENAASTMQEIFRPGKPDRDFIE